jgi:hypothetical protein
VKQYLTHARSLPLRRTGALLVVVGVLATAAHAASLVPDDVSSYAYQPQIGMPGARIRVTWDRPSRVPSSLVVGHVIWRGDILGNFQTAGSKDGDQRFFLDTEATRTIDSITGTPGEDDIGRETITVPGLVPGVGYRYQVSTAYRVGFQNGFGTGGEPDLTTQVMSQLSSRSRWITAIAPPQVLAVNGLDPQGIPQVDPANLSVTWQQTPGADAYVIWVAADPQFRRNRVKSGIIRTVPVDLGGAETMTASLNAFRGRLRRASRLFITVGARNSRDPKPKPFGAIFSPAVTVQPLAAPPPPP